MRTIVMLALLIVAGAASGQEPRQIKVVAFDCFGTVFDLSDTPRDEIRDYIRQVRRPEWAPLDLPASWAELPAFPDSAEGIERLRSRYMVVTCANGPLGLLATMSKRSGVTWDAIIPLELNRVYKPDLRAYRSVAEIMGVEPGEVLIVTGNEGSPDLVAPKEIGMQTMRIRDPDGGPQTIIELAELLGIDGEGNGGSDG